MSKQARTSFNNNSTTSDAANTESRQVSSPDDSTLPPPYSGPSIPPAGPGTSQHLRSDLIPGLPVLHWSDYNPPMSALDGDDLTTIRVSDPRVTSSLSEFTKFINQQTALPMGQTIRITGQHQRYGNWITDFDFRLNMLRYFLPMATEQALNYVRIPGAGDPMFTTQAYAQAFLQDSARPKQFIITRSTSNWDREYISGRVHTLLASLNYRGKVTVDFPITHSKVVINTEPKSIASTFRSLFATMKEYKIEAVWPYANIPSGGDADTRDVQRRCLVRTEEGWWRDWMEVIGFAILNKIKHANWLSLDGWMEVMMTPHGSLPQPRPWGMDE